MSNYPPGHPTGIGRGDASEIWECEGCLILWEVEDLNVGPVHHCPRCKKRVTRALCGTCGEPATRIDVDRAVNAAEPYCTIHGMR